MKKHIAVTLMPLTAIIIGIITIGISFELAEALTGKILRYSYEAAVQYGLIVNNELTSLYFWELDYFRITVHTTFLLAVASTVLYFSIIYKFKRYDRAFVIVILLSIGCLINIPFMIYNFLFMTVSATLVNIFLWLISVVYIILSTICSYLLVKRFKMYRNYTLELKAFFIDYIEGIDTLGYYSHNDYCGVIKYSKESKPIFEEINGEYVIYVSSHILSEFEEEFIYKLGYWSYYIDKVVSRLKNKELDYFDNAKVYGNKILDNFKKTKKGKI